MFAVYSRQAGAINAAGNQDGLRSGMKEMRINVDREDSTSSQSGTFINPYSLRIMEHVNDSLLSMGIFFFQFKP